MMCILIGLMSDSNNQSVKKKAKQAVQLKSAVFGYEACVSVGCCV